MKKIISTIVVLATVFTLFSCLKENHSIRFKNSYSSTIFNVAAGSASFGTVSPDDLTGYQSINAGSFGITGFTNAGQQLSGSGSVSGKGKHKWTLTLSSSGQVAITEDK